MSNKKYYWLKLKDDFFEDDTIAWLEEQENGKDYVIFYLKLCLKSLQDDGKLIRYVGESLIPYDVKALSKLTNTAADTVAVAMKTFLQFGLIERLDTGEIYMKQINEMIGSETHYAVQKRRQRALDNRKKELSGQCPDNVLECPPEIEIEIERELEIDKESMSSSDEPDSTPYKAVVGYLNEKTGSKYRSSTQATQRLIKARFNEGFDLQDFKQVIDNKTNDWLNDKKMAEYLRPQTLFGTKFESYLNQITTNGGGGYDTSEYDDLF